MLKQWWAVLGLSIILPSGVLFAGEPVPQQLLGTIPLSQQSPGSNPLQQWQAPMPPLQQQPTFRVHPKHLAVFRPAPWTAELQTTAELLAAYPEPLSDAQVDDYLRRVEIRYGSDRLSQQESEHLVAHFRRQYPFESIRERLPERHPDARSTKVRLGRQAKQQLATADKTWSESEKHDSGRSRSRALKALHEEQVSEFVDRDGNGFVRMAPPPKSHLLALPAAPAVPFDVVPAHSGFHNKALVTLPKPELKKMRSNEEFRQWAQKNNPLLLPDPQRLMTVHALSRRSFADRNSMGYIKSPDAVAGFRAHRMSAVPPIDVSETSWRWGISHPAVSAMVVSRGYGPLDELLYPRAVPPPRLPQDKVWRVTQLRLVSLLEHPEPVVYASEEFPDMKKLDGTKTVPLDAFETGALKKLYAGAQVEIEPRVNQIRMLGAVRCAKSCMQCHDAKRGELLGAFTYTLTRELPVLLNPKSKRLVKQ